MNIKEHRRRADRMLAEFHANETKIQKLNEDKKRFSFEKEIVGQCQQITESIAETIQRRAHDHLGGFVTRCLQTVFEGEDYEFRLRFDRRRNQTEATPVLIHDGIEVDPMGAAGGGVVDVIAMAMRLAAILTLPRDRLRLTICLDEPFRFLSSEYRPRVRAMLEMLSRETGVQIIQITHATDLETGKIVEVEKA